MRLLILACSKRKKSDPGRISALDRYDGGTYRVIRKIRRQQAFPLDVEVKIVSAQFGLINANKAIPYYDLVMSEQIAKRLNRSTQRKLEKSIAKHHYSEIYVDVGKSYKAALAGFIELDLQSVVFARGRIGERLHYLKEWLSSADLLENFPK